MTKLIICGVNGRMGQLVAHTVASSTDMSVSAGVDKMPDTIANSFPVYSEISDCQSDADVIVDFSRPEALRSNLQFAKQRKMPIVIATTGYTEDEKAIIADTARSIPVFMSANMSLGVNLQMELVKNAAEFWGEDCDIEIVEKHHNQKVDAPSGTALALADCINNALIESKEIVCGRCTRTEKRGREIGIHAVRGGTISGEHSVMFIGTEEILEINHIAQSRQIFVSGALRAAAFICGKPAGLYNMNDIISQSAITNIYKDDDQTMITVAKMPFSPKIIAQMFTDIAAMNIRLDIISQTAPYEGHVSLSFSLPLADLERCLGVLEPYKKDCALITSNESLSKLTVEGPGMQRQSGVASRLFGALSEKNIGIYIITTSETKISFCVDAQRAPDAIGVVAEAFCL